MCTIVENETGDQTHPSTPEVPREEEEGPSVPTHMSPPPLQQQQQQSHGLQTQHNIQNAMDVDANIVPTAAFLAEGTGTGSGVGRPVLTGVGTAASPTFTDVIRRSPPPAPPELLRRLAVRDAPAVGKVKVMLRVSGGEGAPASHLSVDCGKKQVALFQPAAAATAPAVDQDRRVLAPKLFAFDALFSHDHSQILPYVPCSIQGEVCSSALTDVIHAVISGSDGCVFNFGHPGLGKTYSMVGSAQSAHTLGVMPSAIAWLYRAIAEHRARTGFRYSVRVSAAEVAGHMRDLLAGHADDLTNFPQRIIKVC
ncbi:kinesin-like protein KIF26A [Schistocerca serialis cubense]|uniref:kinesin-like protein KIF26A n=1 Tax=Schistocerca serialis cubense TaxID=2023355 RepID=UPI00214E4ACE|nr:kinesin-like protein KIF26A [Schistocerca serialis cubense]